jgi:hypothetical protein
VSPGHRRRFLLDSPSVTTTNALLGIEAGATLEGMTVKDHVIELVRSMSEDDPRLIVAERLLESNRPYADTLRELFAEGVIGADYLAKLEAVLAT